MLGAKESKSTVGCSFTSNVYQRLWCIAILPRQDCWRLSACDMGNFGKRSIVGKA